MTTSAGGRHRRAPARRSVSLAAAVAGALALVVVAAAVTWVLTGGPADVGATTAPTTAAPAAATATATTTVTASPSTTSDPSLLTGTRDIRVKDDVVTILERLSVREGADVVVAPARASTDTALALSDVSQVAEDGTVSSFDAPVTLGAERTLTVQGTYRLTACPDLLPVEWPSPVTVESGSWSLSWTRTSEPLRTDTTLCPRARPQARALAGLTGRLLADHTPGTAPFARIALSWARSNGYRLDVIRVGSAGGLAARAPLANGKACGATPCVLSLAPGERSVLQVQPVESCPNPQGRPDRLVLSVSGTGARRGTLVWLDVPGLGRWLDRTICR